jgi:hypothetical protein
VEELWLPLGTAVIGALSALAGAVLSPWVGSRAEREKWLRDRRAALYEDYVIAAEKALETDERFLPKHNMHEQLGDSASKLGLYASRKVQDQLDAVGSMYLAWVLTASVTRSSPENERSDKLLQAFIKFHNRVEEAKDAIRRDLGTGSRAKRRSLFKRRDQPEYLPSESDRLPQKPA